MKKLVSTFLALSMLCAVSVHSFAEPSADDTDKLLTSVKSRIAISDDYDSFSSNFYTDENGREYTFLWESGGEAVSATVNESGIISDYRYIDSAEDSQGPLIEKASRDDLYKAACGYVKRLNPDIYASLKITDGTNTESTTGNSYYFDIQRYENNILVDGNRGYVAVSTDGKTLKDFSLTYATGIEFEKADSIISRDAAQRAYADKIGFSLCYGSDYGDNGLVAVPIYTTGNKYMQYIGAKDGKPIELNDVSYDTPSVGESDEVPYSEVQGEFAQTDELKGVSGIISERKAEATARSNKIINIPKNYNLKSICGFRGDEGENKYFYTLLFVGAKKCEYAEVMMDAKSGEIVNFSKTQNRGKNSITDQKALKISKNALAVLAPNHTGDYVLSGSTSNGVFSFVRNVNGVEFSANQINIYVDMTNGNVVWYDFSYSNIEFPSLKKVIPKDKISKVFFENSNFEPVYVLNCSKPGMTKYDRATLVYKFSDSDVTEFNAFTGKPIWDNTDR